MTRLHAVRFCWSHAGTACLQVCSLQNAHACCSTSCSADVFVSALATVVGLEVKVPGLLQRHYHRQCPQCVTVHVHVFCIVGLQRTDISHVW
jgi:hypothetical protein